MVDLVLKPDDVLVLIAVLVGLKFNPTNQRKVLAYIFGSGLAEIMGSSERYS